VNVDAADMGEGRGRWRRLGRTSFVRGGDHHIRETPPIDLGAGAVGDGGLRPDVKVAPLLRSGA
jgi:hypothetical protein